MPRYELKNVSDKAAADIERITGVDVSGNKTVIEKRIIQHILKDHGETGKTDRSMRNVNDIARIQYVLDNYDNIESAGTSAAYRTIKPSGKPAQAKTVVMTKAVNGTYYVVEAVPNSKTKTVFVVSAYMSKKAGGRQTAPAKAKRITSETKNAQPPADTSISEQQQDVKDNIGEAEEYGDGMPNSVGAAAAGFATPPEGPERVSNLAGTKLRYNESRGEASGMGKKDYNEAFKYKGQTREQIDAIVDQELWSYYRNDDGTITRKFILDDHPQWYEELTDELRNAPAWNGIMVRMAIEIEHQLQGRARDGKVSDDVYNEWLEVMREHARETGQGVAAWYDPDDGGAGTELNAYLELWDNEKLTDKDRKAIFEKIK